MNTKNNPSKVTAIVPAFNEAPRLPTILALLAASPDINEIIVIDDGSQDNTAAVARQFPIKLIRHERNLGKGQSMEAGVRLATHEILFFCDADVKGLTHAHIAEIINPVRSKQTIMCILIRHHTIYSSIAALARILPHIGGERALTKKLWRQIPAAYKKRFQIETALNSYAKRRFGGYQTVYFPAVTQTSKEKKYGLLPGLSRRLNMIGDIMLAQLQMTIRKE